MGSSNGTVVVITGGTSGIGRQLAWDFAVLGARVIVTRIAASAAEQLLDSARREGLQIDAVTCDVRSANQVAEAAATILGQHAAVDILVNNAGYAVYRPFEESSTQEIVDLLDVNLAGAMRWARALLPSMIARRSGRIVNISSIGGQSIITPNAVYCAAKHGMVAWTKALGYELAPFNVQVNVVCPGHTKTNFHDHPTFRRRDPYRKSIGRSLTVEEVSRAVREAITKDRLVTYVPKRLRLVVWLLDALPFASLPIWKRISRRRIDQLYEQIAIENETRHDP